jgi:hypothetical protein
MAELALECGHVVYRKTSQEPRTHARCRECEENTNMEGGDEAL